MYLLLYPFFCLLWTFSLLPCLNYCEQCCSEHWDACILSDHVFLQIYCMYSNRETLFHRHWPLGGVSVLLGSTFQKGNVRAKKTVWGDRWVIYMESVHQFCSFPLGRSVLFKEGWKYFIFSHNGENLEY